MQTILQQIRTIVRQAAPDAVEKIRYRMPAFFLDGVLIYFAAFNKHIGIFPPVRGDDKLIKRLKPYSGEKGNLRLPLDQPIPYPLIKRVVSHRIKECHARTSKTRRSLPH